MDTGANSSPTDSASDTEGNTLNSETQADSGADPSADPVTDPSTDPSTDPATDPSADPATDPSADPSSNPETPSDPPARAAGTGEEKLRLSKIISSHEVPEEDDLEQIRARVIASLFNFEEVEGQTCPVCMKGFTQLESRTCIETEVYSFSLGLSLF